MNVSGAFLLGCLAGSSGPMVTVVGVGGLGAYTTFSSFELETYRAVADGAWAITASYTLGSVIAGYVALWLGAALARLF